MDESSAYYQEQVRQAKQIMTPFTLQMPAQVTSAESVPGQGVQYEVLSADGDSVDVVQGRGGEVTQGQSVHYSICTPY